MKKLLPLVLSLLLLVGCATASADHTAAAQTDRPVAVMVSNAYATTGRQWGLSGASLVVEGLTEGKSTNWMLWFDNLQAVPKVGPVTQGKDLFWQLALPQNAILVQKGMNTYAENLLNVYGYQPLDALMLGVNSFDYDGSSTDQALTDEYCWYTKGSSLQYGIDYYQMPLQAAVPAWLPAGKAQPSGAAAAALTVRFSDTDATIFKYENGVWAAYQHSDYPYTDANDGTPVTFANVVVLKADHSVKDDKFTREYDLSGGTGLYLVEGTWQPITWKKGEVADQLTLYNEKGDALTLAEGKTYMAIYGGFKGQALTLTDAAGTELAHGL